jgi:SAM-dependent methyltransferase
MYSSLAEWWPVLSSPDDYREEAAFFAAIMKANCRPCHDVLELGSGGGNNASHLKKHFTMTLVDISPGMLRVSRKLNPECRHVMADMRKVRLHRTFDAVFIHDAVMYLTSIRDLTHLFRTAWIHLRKGGGALIVPDYFKETYQPVTRSGGHDRGQKSMRYLEWHFDPDPGDHTIECHFAFLLKDRRVRIEYDKHVMGLFPKAVWLKLLRRAGFRVTIIPISHSELEPGIYQALAAVKK